MWNCPACGCQAIAPGLTFCPMCFAPREDDMPKATSGGPSNAWDPADSAPGQPGETPTVTAPEPAPVPEPEPEQLDINDFEPNAEALARRWAAEHGIIIPDADPVPDYVLQAAKQQGA